MGFSIRWTPEVIETCKEVLKRQPYGRVKQAAAEIARITGQPITRGNLKDLFFRRGFGKPIDWTGNGGRVNAVVPEKLPATVAEMLEDYEPPTQRRPDPVREHEERQVAKDERKAHDELVREIIEHRKRQEYYERLANGSEPPRVPRRELTSGMRELTGVVLFSDWHVEETVRPESVMGRNEFNLSISEQRIDRAFEAVAWNFEHHRASGQLAIRDLVVWLGGDLFSGFIHEDLVQGNALSPVESILWLKPRLIGGLRMLLERLQLESLVVPCSYGNHGRTTAKPRVSCAASNSYEWAMYQDMQQWFADDPRVRFEATTAAHQYVQVYDWTLRFHHGDHVNYQGGVQGIGVPIGKAVASWDSVCRADITNVGHWHTQLDYGRFVLNGSLIGYSPYSLRIKAPYEPPQQTIYYVDSRRGKCMTTALWVDGDSSCQTSSTLQQPQSFAPPA